MKMPINLKPVRAADVPQPKSQPARAPIDPILGSNPTYDVGPLDMPVGYFLVVDPDTKEEIGRIPYPLEFCSGVACDKIPSNAEHPYSFMRRFNPFVWYHRYCERPTKEWWSSHFEDIVEVNPDAKLPWQ
jgi:hypothetical protein